MPADILTYEFRQVILIHQLLQIDIRIVGCEEDDSRDQKFIIPAIILQLVTRLLLVSQIHKYLSRFGFQEESVG